jgi:hypothetical protein
MTGNGDAVGRGEAADIAALGDATGWPAAAGRLMADLGFSLIRSDRPDAPGGAHLLIALRATPTLRHFDPETVSYWAPVAGRGRVAVLDRRTELPVEGVVSWGTIRVVDRLGEDNRFLTFGGTIRAVAADTAETLAMHASPGPLVRWSGHSQGLDPLAGEIGAFFARLMVRVDFEPGIEGTLAATPPLDLYAAFVRDRHTRLDAAPLLAQGDPSFTAHIRAESSRLETHAPEAWTAGGGLIGELGLDR